MAKTEPFNKHRDQYEKWFEDNRYVFLSELEAIRSVLPKTGKGVEIGVGSGIFASQLGIVHGCDPSDSMRIKAIERGINAVKGIAEKLPYTNESFDFALMVTTICFVDDPEQSFKEIHRILKQQGNVIVGFVDRESPVGKEYLKYKEESVFYKEARFFSTPEIMNLLTRNGFIINQTLQTIFNPLTEIRETQMPENGYGIGSFVIVKATKNG